MTVADDRGATKDWSFLRRPRFEEGFFAVEDEQPAIVPGNVHADRGNCQSADTRRSSSAIPTAIP